MFQLNWLFIFIILKT